MPDFTIHVAPVCQSNVEWVRMVPSSSDPNVVYTVRWTEQYGRKARYRFAFECDCIASRVNGKECKHIQAVKAERCRWNWEQEPVDPQGNCCPDCKGPLAYIKVAC